MMKGAVIGATATVCLTLAVLGGFTDTREALAQRTAPHDTVAKDGLIAFSASAGDYGQQITVIDPVARVMGVYWVDGEGKLALKSVRTIKWDLQMVDFNGVSPQSREVRSLVEQK
jgi:hypothetical protein